MIEVTEVMKSFDGEEFSPYVVGKTLNRTLGNVPPQMIYNYISKKRLPNRTNSLGKKFLTRDDVQKFATELIEFRTKKQTEETQEA